MSLELQLLHLFGHESTRFLEVILMLHVKFSVIIGSLCQEESLEKVNCLLIEMENRGCALDGVTYYIVVRSLLKKNEFHHTIPFLEEMPKREFSADSATSSMLIDQVLAQNGDDFLLKLMENVLPEDIIRALY